jgi:hypothetical protein
VHTAVVAPNVIVGNGFTVIVKFVGAADTHPAALLTVSDPVYVPPAVPAGTAILIEFAGKEALVTGKKLFAGLAFHVIL